ncbi:MAG TPA: asparagine synthase-related protein [Gemmatimonadales bacterium]|nr:asparagine synthase-related protein [Gemmatimonadales bacterium]
MGAVYGILGDASSAELTAMGNRLAHRGAARAEWSPAAQVHFGLRGSTGAVERAAGGPLVFDGFIDNRSYIASIGGRKVSAPLDVDADSELVLELCASSGTERLHDLAGQFAIAWWDGARQRLILARDRIGYAPLYFTIDRGRFVFASEYKALLALEGVPARPNRDAIQVIQATKWVQPGATCLEGIYPVAPGTWLSVEGNRLLTARFWHLPISVTREDEAHHAGALRTTFLETLRQQTEGYERIGISLSGGLDSAVMAAGARHVAPSKELHTFSAGYGPDDKELVNAAAVARELGTRHHPLILDPDDLPDLLPWMVWHMEEPIGREDIAYLFVAAREAAHHVDLVLTGFGFDGLFAGLPRHRVADVAIKAPVLAGPLREFYDYSVRSVRPVSMAGRLLTGGYFRGRDFPAPEVIGAASVPRLAGFGNGADQPLSQFLRRGFLVLPYQSVVERLYTAAGVRFNAHHTNPAFIRAAFSIPDRLKIKGRTQKYILRKACAGLLPDSILSYGKSFNRLKHDLHLSAVLDRMADQLLANGDISRRGLFSPEYVSRLRQRSRDKPYSQERGYRLWSLLLAEMWSRMYLDKRGAPPEAPMSPVRALE